ncbi:glycosyltransferase family 2 protein [Ideonella dechloratans]|uniref:glycosyltransferase family 2 protein n=1 Tax=Ideonella dechloratans TaxID=36863 RepID=UPI0035AF2C30
MKIVAVVGVMDERELLPECVRHLYDIGVDEVVVRDAGSTDGSLEWAQAHQGPRLRLVPVSEEEKTQPPVWHAREREIAEMTRADWVLHLDADEFWLPATGQLRDSPQWHDEALDLIRVARYNVALGPSGREVPWPPSPHTFDRLWLFARPIPEFRQHLQTHPLTPWISGVPVPKIAVRPRHLATLEPGCHEAHGLAGQPFVRAASRDIVTAHLPFSTFGRFARKLANIRALFRDYPERFPPGAAWHWRRWAALPDDAAVQAEFALQHLDAQEFATLQADGALQSARQLLDRLGAAP